MFVASPPGMATDDDTSLGPDAHDGNYTMSERKD